MLRLDSYADMDDTEPSLAHIPQLLIAAIAIAQVNIARVYRPAHNRSFSAKVRQPLQMRHGCNTTSRNQPYVALVDERADAIEVRLGQRAVARYIRV